MSDSIFFTSTDSPEGTVFSVHPYRPGEVLFVFLAGGLVLFLGVWTIAFVIIQPILASAILGPLGILLYAGRNFQWPPSKAKPKTIDIVASRNGIKTTANFFPTSDIEELYYVAPDTPNGARVALGGTGAFGASAALGSALLQGVMDVRHANAAKHASCSYRLYLRKRSHGAPVTLAYGLTHEVAASLTKELARALGW